MDLTTEKAYDFRDSNTIVHSCTVNNNVSVKLKDVDCNISLTVFTAFRLTVNGETHRIDPETNDNVDEVLRLLGCRILSITVSENNVLEVIFGSGSQILVHPHSEYESWTVTFNEPRTFIVGTPL